MTDTSKTVDMILLCMGSITGNEHMEVTPDMTWESLGWDSLDSVEFVMVVEREFSIDIPDEEAEQWKGPYDAIAAVDDALGETP